MTKQLFFACGLALALVFAPFGASAQQQRTPERQAILERLGAVLPPSGTTPQDSANQVRPTFAQLESRMNARNPGREAEIGALLDGYALCIGTAMNAAAPGLVLEAADIALSDAEIEYLITFYSGPDYIRFSDINGRISRNEQIPSEDMTFFRSYISNPGLQRFAMQTVQTAQGFANTPAGQQIVATCGNAFLASYRSAGLQPL